MESWSIMWRISLRPVQFVILMQPFLYLYHSTWLLLGFNLNLYYLPIVLSNTTKYNFIPFNVWWPDWKLLAKFCYVVWDMSTESSDSSHKITACVAQARRTSERPSNPSLGYPLVGPLPQMAPTTWELFIFASCDQDLYHLSPIHSFEKTCNGGNALNNSEAKGSLLLYRLILHYLRKINRPRRSVVSNRRSTDWSTVERVLDGGLDIMEMINSDNGALADLEYRNEQVL